MFPHSLVIAYPYPAVCAALCIPLHVNGIRISVKKQAAAHGMYKKHAVMKTPLPLHSYVASFPLPYSPLTFLPRREIDM